MKYLTHQIICEKYIFGPIMKQARIAIFASGKGTNAEKIIEYFTAHSGVKICMILTNNPQAGVVDIGSRFNIPVISFNRNEFYHSSSITDKLDNEKITHIVLAGFLWLIPETIIHRFSNKIVNIHPALLPRFGGKGMYGNHVHEAVKESGVTETGITIHLVNEKYDDGRYLYQHKVHIDIRDSVDDITKKVKELEHVFYPKVIEQWLEEDYFSRVE